MKYLPCVEGKKCPSVKSWGTNVPYTGFVGRERLLVCGDDINKAEALDFDDHGSAWEEYWSEVPDDLKSRVYVERTPSGGMHLVYRCTKVETNRKLAVKADGSVLIETRGYGGLLKVAPSEGYEHLSGPELDELELISEDDRQGLLNIARALDQSASSRSTAREPRSTRQVVVNSSLEESPVDYVRRNGADLVVSELVKRRWTVVCEKGNKIYLSHPDASNPSDIHLTVDRDGGWVHNFSANKSEPFMSDKTYSAYDALALLMFNGDQGELGRYVRETYLGTGAGNGADSGADGAGIEVDFSSMLTDAKYEDELPVVEYPTLEVSKNDIPFILREYVDEVLDTSKCPQFPMALYSGIVACGYAVARRLRMDWDGHGWAPVKAPVYVLALGGSGRGKNQPLSACKTMSSSYEKLFPGVLTSPRSEQVVTEAVCEFKKVLLLFDEVGDALFSDRSNSFTVGLKRVMKELYNADSKYTPPRSIASNTRMRNKLGTDCPIISNPACNVYATGIPSVVYKLMSDTDLEEGLAGRFLICLEDKLSEVENNVANIRPFILPESVAHWCDMWGSLGGVEDFGITDALQDMGCKDVPEYEPNALTEANTALVFFDEGVLGLLKDVGDEYSKLAESGSPAATAYSRGQHNVQILATILACAEGECYDRIPVKVKHVEFAKKLVDYSIACLQYLLANKTAYDDSTNATKEDNSTYGRSVAFLNSWGKSMFSVREFNSHVKVHGSASRRALTSLLDEGLISKTSLNNVYSIVKDSCPKWLN